MTPEIIQAFGVAIAAILTAWQAMTSRKVRELEARYKAVETQRDQYRTKLRVAAQHIRDWMRWAMHYAPGTPTPALPHELADEV